MMYDKITKLQREFLCSRYLTWAELDNKKFLVTSPDAKLSEIVDLLEELFDYAVSVNCTHIQLGKNQLTELVKSLGTMPIVIEEVHFLLDEEKLIYGRVYVTGKRSSNIITKSTTMINPITPA